MTQSIYDKNWFINIVDTRSNDTKQISIDDTKQFKFEICEQKLYCLA